MDTAIKHPVLDRVKPSFVIFDIRALCQSARMSKITNDGFREVAGSNPTNGCCVPTPTQRAIPPGLRATVAIWIQL